MLRHQRSRSECSVYEIESNRNLPGRYIDAKNLSNSIGEFNGTINNFEQLLHGVEATPATISSPEFISHLLQVLFTGLSPPDPVVVKALTHDPLCFFLSCLPNSAPTTVIDPLGFSLECGKRNISRDTPRRFSNTVMRLFSPLRKKSRRLYFPNRPTSSQQRTRVFRPSTVSLPAQMVRIAVDPGTRGEHWWSIVQLAAETPTRSSSQPSRPPIVPPPAASSPKEPEAFQKSTRVAESALGVIGMGENVPVPSEGISTTVEAIPSHSSSPVVATDEVQIGRLKKNVQRLEAAIRNIESRKTELSDWFLDQMLVARGAGDDRMLSGGIGSSGSSLPPEEEIKRNYKRRNAELKQRLTELEARLSGTRQVISHLQEGVKVAANERSAERKVKRTPSSPSHPSKSSPTTDGNRLSTGQTVVSNEDTGIFLLQLWQYP
ncbi:hypothetical protein Aperf_G00000063788 [Anoplocephala perfoliata]